MAQKQNIQKLKSSLTIIVSATVVATMIIAGFLYPLPIWLPVIFTLVFLIGIETGWANYKLTGSIQESTLDDTRSGASAGAARAGAMIHQKMSATFILIQLVLIIALCVVVFVFLYLYTSPTFVLSWSSVAAPLMLILYVLFLRKIIGKKPIQALKLGQEKVLTQLKISDNIIHLDLIPTHLGGKKPNLVKIKLSEITKLQVLNYQEVEAIKSYEIGPDVKLVAQSQKDLFQYLRGKIERPRAFLKVVNNPILSHVLLQGSDFLYVFSLPSEQAEQAQEAWNKYIK